MYSNNELSKYVDDATILSKSTAIWVIPYTKEYLFGDLSREKYKELIKEILIENNFNEDIDKIIKEKFNYGKILNMQDIVIENILRIIEDSKDVEIYTQDMLLEDYEINYLLRAILVMFIELLHKIDVMIEEIKRDKENRK